MKSKAILIGTMAILAIFVGTSAFSNSAHAARIDVTCAAPPGQTAAPSPGTTLNYAVILGNNVKITEVVKDDLLGNIRGWNPNGVDTQFTVGAIPIATILDALNSVVVVSTWDDSSFNVCGVSRVIPVGIAGIEENITKSIEANMTKPMNTTASE